MADEKVTIPERVMIGAGVVMFTACAAELIHFMAYSFDLISYDAGRPIGVLAIGIMGLAFLVFGIALAIGLRALGNR